MTLSNHGQSALPGSYSLAIYASRKKMLDHSAILLGSVDTTHALRAGESEEVRVGLASSKKLAAGNYHLIAVMGTGNSPVEFASTRIFVVREA